MILTPHTHNKTGKWNAVVHSCNHNTLEVKPGELNEFEAIRGFKIRLYFNKTKKEQANKRPGKMVLIKNLHWNDNFTSCLQIMLQSQVNVVKWEMNMKKLQSLVTVEMNIDIRRHREGQCILN